MERIRARRPIALVMAITVIGSVLLAPAAIGSTVYRTKGNGSHFWVSWTEYDPDDTLGLPGNVHVGWLGGWNDQYGTYFHGNVTDFDCDPGEVPWGGHGGHAAVVEVGVETATAAAAEAVDEIADSGAARVDPNFVIDAVQQELSEEIPAAVTEEAQACDYLQDRFLDGSEATFKVDMNAKTVKVTGTLTVFGGHGGGHGDPGPVLGRPPVNLTISGGEWWNYEWTNKYWNASFKYSDWRKGTDYYGGTVTGAIGAMGFDDDPDDESFGGFGGFQFKTVEKLR